MTWTQLLANNEVQQHKTSKKELDGIRVVIARDLADASLKGLSPDRCFATAYNAALQAAKMAIDCAGYRTPGFSGWQQERWFTHCSDGAEFLGAMGKQELLRAGADAVKVIRDESGYASDEWERYFDALNAEHGPATAYLFKCRHCGTIGGYSDCR